MLISYANLSEFDGSFVFLCPISKFEFAHIRGQEGV